MLTAVFRASAEEEFEAAYRWYEEQAGLGAEFARAIDATIAFIERNPELYPLKYRNVRGAPVRRFPYVIYYLVQTDRVDIVACFHTRRHPRNWRSRLR
jgi:plasmid stabilization system protein ParE